MKKKEILDDLEIHLDPKPLTKEEELGLSLFIRQLKKRKALLLGQLLKNDKKADEMMRSKIGNLSKDMSLSA